MCVFLERTAVSATVVSPVTGASPPVGPVPATDTLTTATLSPDAASTAGTIAPDTLATGESHLEDTHQTTHL